ncbi:MAG TPA: hypothetical protein VGN04_02780 [Herbaspirillum sp.]|jgi:hypothetical protein
MKVDAAASDAALTKRKEDHSTRMKRPQFDDWIKEGGSENHGTGLRNDRGVILRNTFVNVCNRPDCAARLLKNHAASPRNPLFLRHPAELPGSPGKSSAVSSAVTIVKIHREMPLCPDRTKRQELIFIVYNHMVIKNHRNPEGKHAHRRQRH